jgi:hypothetical protein
VRARRGQIALVAVLVLAAAGCGGSDGTPKKSSAQTATSGTQSGPSGASGAVAPKTKPRQPETGGARTPSDEEKSAPAGATPPKPATPRPKKRRKRTTYGVNSLPPGSLRLYFSQARIVCKFLTLDGMAKEYEIESKDPGEIAEAYSAAFPITARRAVFKGCKAGLLASAK